MKAKPSSRTATSKTRRRPARNAADAVVISHPTRVVFPGTGITKGDVAVYYRQVAPLMMREIANRPLSVVRCPNGIAKACFFQKHLARGWGAHVLGVDIKTEPDKYLCVREAAGLLELVQMNVLEIHVWGATADDVDHADRMVFDLDPHAGVKWPRIAAAAVAVRDELASIGLTSFVRTSGNKGLHVVVPLRPAAPWPRVREFAQAFAHAMAARIPRELVAVAGESKRKDRIFIDYLRNGRGATSVASFSLRAKPAAGVAMPLAWNELARLRGGDAFTIRNALDHVRRRKSDPWKSIGTVRQPLPDVT